MGYIPPPPPPLRIDSSGNIGFEAGCGSDNVAFGYTALGNLPPAGSHSTDPFSAQDAPTFCYCAYCGAKNATTREECRSCRAPLPDEDDALEMEIPVFGGDSVTVRGPR